MRKLFQHLLAPCVVVGLCIPIYAQRQIEFVSPASTDPEITTNLANHYTAIDPSVEQKNLLFVFLPGTGGIPIVYREITNNAADRGFHSLALTYPNNDAVNFLCGMLQTDLDCYADVRLEIKDGTDRTDKVDVNRPNSIENRLIKLLTYLDAKRPAQNWGQFLLDGSAIDWSKIVIAGHSQGGGHAGIIGRYHLVRRVLMYAAADYNGILQTPANWIARPETTPNASPPDRFWAFSHQQDESVNYTNQVTKIWPAYGMPVFGAPENVDIATHPYNSTHSLTSSRPCENHHGCIAVDIRLVYENGVPVYKPVWDYMLENAESTVSVSEVSFMRGGIEVSRPPVGMTTKRFRVRLTGLGFDQTSRVFINDVETATSFIAPGTLDATLPAGKFGGVGLSGIRVTSGNGSESNTIRY